MILLGQLGHLGRLSHLVLLGQLGHLGQLGQLGQLGHFCQLDQLGQLGLLGHLVILKRPGNEYSFDQLRLSLAPMVILYSGNIRLPTIKKDLRTIVSQ